jgi:NAD(P)-dependent dehydrogenase (short-subunit alcohol dehydrogenase family)
MGLLDGAKVIVTGGGSGIGAAAARRMASEGARVAVLDRKGDAARSVAEEIGGVAIEVDVVDGDAVERATAAAVEALGGLTTVFLNAGVGSLKPLDTYTDMEWDRLVDVNLKGTFHGLRSAVPHLRAEGGGAIVTMASVSGLRPTRGEAPYAAAKAGIIALTRSAALEYGPDAIRVNAVSPGFIRTPLTEFAWSMPDHLAALESATPLGRAGTPDDVVGAVLFLVSDLSAYVTGHNLVVDGGSLLPSAQMDPLLRDLIGS